MPRIRACLESGLSRERRCSLRGCFRAFRSAPVGRFSHGAKLAGGALHRAPVDGLHRRNTVRNQPQDDRMSARKMYVSRMRAFQTTAFGNAPGLDGLRRAHPSRRSTGVGALPQPRLGLCQLGSGLWALRALHNLGWALPGVGLCPATVAGSVAVRRRTQGSGTTPFRLYR